MYQSPYERNNYMLELNGIVKKYETGGNVVSALAGVDLCFRENEFVSILGPSGCGKTTLLNIIGGLDRYTEGDLFINGKSTRFFRDSDWDTYRNHSIGFVFQSYNLIPHQTVLANVELALTLSGVSKSERKARAIEALKKVGLGDQLHKKPNQMSGGQMQRVAIARALVNDPDILLADEPTGALDTQTSIQIMDLLKEVANDRLVIMVTHNPDLAEEYSTRIVRLSDGLVTDDSNPITAEEYEAARAKDQRALIEQSKSKKAKKAESKKTSMSFATAISLSFKNLLTKKGRTILTSFAGSIGIIGIALVLSLSNGIQLFIDQVQEDTLSTYPLSIQKETQDMSAMLEAMTSVSETIENPDPNKIYVDDSLGTMMSAMTSTVSNNLEAFKEYIEKNYDDIKDYVSDIQYTYDYDLEVYNSDGTIKVGMATLLSHMGEQFQGLSSMMELSGMGGMDVMSEMINNQELLEQQYELVDGTWPKNDTDVVLVVGKNNQISKLTLYMLGILPHDDLEEIMTALMTGQDYDDTPIEPYSVDDFIGMKFNLLTTQDFFEKNDSVPSYTLNGKSYPVWRDMRDYMTDEALSEFINKNSTELKISGIIRPRVDVAAASISGAIGYTKGLTDLILEKNTQSEIINQQKETPTVNVLTGIEFKKTDYTPETIKELIKKIDDATMEQFYAIMTQRILDTPELLDKLVVNSDNFLGMFMLFPEESRATVLDAIIKSANANNPVAVQTLCAIISSQTGGITVTPDNFAKLLPVLDLQSHVMAALMGLPVGDTPIPGLIELAGEQTMSALYDSMSVQLKNFQLNEEMFIGILSTLDENDENFIMIEEMLYSMAPQTDATLDSTLRVLGAAEKASPASINFYSKDFDSKEKIEEFIAKYNKNVKDEKDVLHYTDLIGTMMSSVSIIIDVISYVLIAFVSISLVVSSIMIGIITNISVLERTKEIGILRAIGASKKDISNVFNAETFIIGLIAGFIGIAFTLLLCLPVNAIIQALSGFSNIRAVLPWLAGIILVVISMLLTILAGLIPAKSASKKDPVIALRTE